MVGSKSVRFSVRAHRTTRGLLIQTGRLWFSQELETIVCAPLPVQNPTYGQKGVFRVLFLVAFPDPGFKVSPDSLIDSA